MFCCEGGKKSSVPFCISYCLSSILAYCFSTIKIFFTIVLKEKQCLCLSLFYFLLFLMYFIPTFQVTSIRPTATCLSSDIGQTVRREVKIMRRGMTETEETPLRIRKCRCTSGRAVTPAKRDGCCSPSRKFPTLFTFFLPFLNLFLPFLYLFLTFSLPFFTFSLPCHCLSLNTLMIMNDNMFNTL